MRGSLSNSCSMGTQDLPDIYALARGPLGPPCHAFFVLVRKIISGKSLVPMLQLIYSTWVTHLQVLGSLQVYLYWPLLISIVQKSNNQSLT